MSTQHSRHSPKQPKTKTFSSKHQLLPPAFAYGMGDVNFPPTEAEKPAAERQAGIVSRNHLQQRESKNSSREGKVSLSYVGNPAVRGCLTGSQKIGGCWPFLRLVHRQAAF